MRQPTADGGYNPSMDDAAIEHRPPMATLGDLPLDFEADLERLLVDRDPSARIAFEVRARNEFFDLKPVLDQYRAARTSTR